MKVAFSVWNGRIAPVFDVAGTVVIRKIVDGVVESQKTIPVSTDNHEEKIATLVDIGVTDIICGALSRRFQLFIESKGIKVIPFISGDIDKVSTAFSENKLDSSFSMPGCAKREGQGRGRCCRNHFNNF